jgi:hypothetical protein
MAVSGQLCMVAEGLSCYDITLAHRQPPPSPQKSDTCANPVQKCRRAAPFLQGDILDSYKSLPSGNLAGPGLYKLVPAKSRACVQGD